MVETLEQRRNRLTRIRRERIIEFVKQQYWRQFEARDAFLDNFDKVKEIEKDRLWNEYTRIFNEGSMFRYGVAMADPDGKWMKNLIMHMMKYSKNLRKGYRTNVRCLATERSVCLNHGTENS